MLADQDMWCREENFTVFMYVLRSIVTPWSGLRNSRYQSHAHVYFFIFPWLALYEALVYLIHLWPMLEKMRKTLSVAILVAIKVFVDNVCACEKRDLVKPRFWKRAWILLRREVNYYSCPGHRPWARVIICVGFFLFFCIMFPPLENGQIAQ